MHAYEEHAWRFSRRDRLACVLLNDTRMKTFSIRLFFCATALAMHCESQTGDVPDASDDAAADAAPSDDASADAGPAPYPAPHPSAPTIRSLGGPVLASPHVIPIVFENDSLAPTIGSFTKALQGSQYWKATTSEYGIGDLSVDDVVVVPASDTLPGATISDAQIQAFLAAHLDGAHAGFGQPDPSTIYALFYPAGTTVTKENGESCKVFGGYHRQVPLGAMQIAYVVIPRCSIFNTLSGADAVTAAASHELVEAATDPFEMTTPAYLVPDDDHMAYGFYPDTELADMCSTEDDSYFKADVGFMVQRTWSNSLAALGGSGCAPLPPNYVYWAASPVLTEKVNMDLTSQQMGIIVTKGVTVPLGESRTIDVDVFTTGPTGPLNLFAFDYPQLQGQSAELELTFDQATGVNGDTRKLTIKRVAQDPTYGGTAFVVMTYTDVNHAHPVVGFAAQ